MDLEIIILSEVSQTKIRNLKNDTGKIKNDTGDFPGGPVVKIPCIQCSGDLQRMAQHAIDLV